MKLGICGICGRMGASVFTALRERGHVLAAGFDQEGAPQFGRDAGTVIHADPVKVIIGAIDGKSVSACDALIDFSTPAATQKLLEAAVASGKPIVIGTTGFSDDGKKKIEEASRSIPILFSPNMSLGVNLLFKLTEIAAAALTKDYDVEIFEAHHRFKKDAPSGTAKRLLEIVKSSMKGLSGAKEIFGREGMVGERTDNEVAVLAMRGGDIVGEHTVFFTGIGDRIELTHRASSRDVLAKGAVAAAEFLSGKPAGMYSMYDVLGL